MYSKARGWAEGGAGREGHEVAQFAHHEAFWESKSVHSHPGGGVSGTAWKLGPFGEYCAVQRFCMTSQLCGIYGFSLTYLTAFSQSYNVVYQNTDMPRDHFFSGSVFVWYNYVPVGHCSVSLSQSHCFSLPWLMLQNPAYKSEEFDLIQLLWLCFWRNATSLKACVSCCFKHKPKTCHDNDLIRKHRRCHASCSHRMMMFCSWWKIQRV